MTKPYKNALFIFHRDLRIDDNKALLEACKQSQTVVPIFIFDVAQVSTKNDYKSNNAVQFMIESLQDLQQQFKQQNGKLFIFYGKTETIIKDILQELTVDAVFFNEDYTPFAIERDKNLTLALEKKSIAVHSFQGLLLTDPKTLRNQSGQPYTVFTPFFNKASEEPVKEPEHNHHKNFHTNPISNALDQKTDLFELCHITKNSKIAVHGGTSNAKKILKNLDTFKDYLKTRDFPELSTTHLSAHLKFGTVSPQKVIHAVKEHKADKGLIRQLYWRDFYTHIAFHFPHVFGKAFNKNYQRVSWSHNKKAFEQWCNGQTGFPLVDAGMRQLNTTGYMHNRVRMVVCSFLTKNLHIDWQWGEKYFAQKLVDYDPAVNNGSWQWGASTGADAAPYFRVFNPWLQQKKFDADCVYIKQWVPELQLIAPKEIHSYFKATQPLTKEYPLPMVDHAITSQQAKKMFI
ncbi:MAG: deoxyribodipyrimidine photo-lyase [Proteobacteria bacterium]|nr:deoxyribodipyrimidine photo-lyase [Pseudomonadota bacterium]NBP14729.1 deoxyribodipyrimidine photo-lyase [bacterium]